VVGKFFRVLKKIIKISCYLLVFIFFLLAIPAVPGYLGNRGMAWLNSEYNVDIEVERLSVSLTGMIGLDGVLIRDHHRDTLIAAQEIRTPILDIRQLINGNLYFSTIEADGLYLDMKTYKGDTLSNLDIFISRFDSGAPASQEPFIMKANEINLREARFRVWDEDTTGDPTLTYIDHLSTRISDFSIYDSEVTMEMKTGSLRLDKHLQIEELSTYFHYNNSLIALDKVLLKTPYSQVDADISFHAYKESYADFLNKVTIEATLRESHIGTEDINGFYNGFGQGKLIDIEGEGKGTLNNLSISNINLYTENTAIEAEEILLRNAFDKGKDFVFWGNFPHFASVYSDLAGLMPEVLGKQLPEELRDFGFFEGVAELTYTTRDLLIDADVFTQKGDFILSGSLYNISHPKEATYEGSLETYRLQLGKLLRISDMKELSAGIKFSGKGIDYSHLNNSNELSLTTTIHSVEYRDYLYQDIELKANYAHRKLKANAQIADKHLNMHFEGAIDLLSSKKQHYSLTGEMNHVDLKALGFIKKDSIAQVRGNIDLNIKGNTLDDMEGRIVLKNASYKKNIDTYNFADFSIEIQKDTNSVRTITLESPDIISGKVEGEFKFAQIGKVLVNTLAYGFDNYKPFKVMQGQYLTFDFKIYNKIIEIFLPELSFAPNTFIRGKLVGDENDFKINFRSPYIHLYETTLKGVNLEYDKKNPHYRSLIQLSSIQNPYYQIEEFNILNTSKEDTLFFKTEFKGGKNSEDDYTLNFYHTINKKRQSEVGMLPSTIFFKNNEWHIGDERETKVVFDRKMDSIYIQHFRLHHENETIAFDGRLGREDYKDLHLVFDKVNINDILPKMEGLDTQGILNGHLSLLQRKKLYYPSANLSIKGVSLNSYDLGDLIATLEGNEDLTFFKANLEFLNELGSGLHAYGGITVDKGDTWLNLTADVNKVRLEPFSPLMQDILSDLKGSLTGQARITGTASKPKIEGSLLLNEGSVGVPYLKVDMDVAENTLISLQDNQFVFQETTLTDKVFKTQTAFNGRIYHRDFSDWFLDLHFNTKGKKFLVLNTQAKDNDLFYGTAFIVGKASITGNINELTIGVKAVSGEGTQFKIPLSDTQTVGDDSFINFVGKETIHKKGIVPKTYQGLEMNFDVDILPTAKVEIIVDPKNNSNLIGRGAGTILLEINTNGKFNMWGDFITTSGEYNFKYEGLIDKKFKVLPGGSISWNGEPMGASLQNLKAAYSLYANPSILLNSNQYNRKILTQVVINLQGDLTRPETVFDIQFPDSSPNLTAELNYRLEDRDKKQLQAFSLLAQGNFLSDASAGDKLLSYNMLETAAGIFNQLLSSEDDKLNMGLSYETGDANPNGAYSSADRLGITVSTDITEWMRFNGKLGIPVGGVTQTAVAGDFELQFLLTKDGRLSAKIFNREDELQQYLIDRIDYSQGVGLTYKVDFNTFKELIQGIFKRAKEKK